MRRKESHLMSDKDTAVYAAETKKLNELFRQKKAAEKEKGNDFKQKTIAELAGWTQPNVSAYLRGVVVLKEDSAQVFADALGVPVRAFSPRLAASIAQRELLENNPLLTKAKVTYVPIIAPSMMDLIRSQLKDPEFTMPMSESITPVCQPVSNRSFGIELSDLSLSGEYPIGTTFVFDPTLKAQPTDIVYVGNKNADSDYHVRVYEIKEILEDGTERYELRALNNAFPTLRENYEVLGVAIAAVKKLRPTI